MFNRMTAAEIAECARLADVVDGPLSTAGAEAYSALGAMAKRMARELAVMRAEREARDAAWARLVKAERDKADAERAVEDHGASEEDDGCRQWERDAAAKHAAARQVLLDLGVDAALLSD